MKKTTRILSFVLSLTMIFTLCACGKKTDDPAKAVTKEFTSSAGFKITLPEDYTEKTDVSTVTCYFEGKDGVVTALKEEKSVLQTAAEEELTLEKYAELVLKANNLDTAAAADNEGNTFFTYEKTVDGNEFFYYGVVKESDDAFWLFNFACLKSARAQFEPVFPTWAASIKF